MVARFRAGNTIEFINKSSREVGIENNKLRRQQLKAKGKYVKLCTLIYH